MEHHNAHVDIAIVGGSGLAALPMADARTLSPVATPYGPVAGVTVGSISSRRVAFLARHGTDHHVPPHRLNSRAQLWALASLGAGVLLSTNAVGGLSPSLRPGDLVLTDQLIDRTHGRADTYFDGDEIFGADGVQHLPFAEPYSARLRDHAHAVLTARGERVHAAGVSVVIQGPRFATRAEADWHRAMGADLVNMTQLPEAALAAELGLAHLNIAIVTDTDTEHGAGEADTSATAERVFAVMAAATPRLIGALEAIIPALAVGGSRGAGAAGGGHTEHSGAPGGDSHVMTAQQRMLITGGAGFIGGAIATAALAAGWRVRVLDSLRTDVHGPGASPPEFVMDRADPRIETVVGDVRDRPTVAACLRDVDVVCHQAAKVGLGVDISDAPDYVTSNSLATAVLLAAMHDAGVDRLVLASSMVVYGEGLYRDGEQVITAPPRSREDLENGRFDPRSPSGGVLQPMLIDEDRPCDPRNVYAATKFEQELLARDWVRSSGGRAALLRYHNVYGPHMPQGTPYAGVASLFRSALERGERPRVFEDGKQRRDFVHVTDVASANLAAADWTRGASPGVSRAFNVGSGEVHTIGEFAHVLAAAMQAPAPRITGEFRMGDVRHITASSARIREELGWRPTVSFEDGVTAFATDPLRVTAVPD